MTLAGEGWRHGFGIACLALQLITFAASTFIITKYPHHRVLQGRDLWMTRINVLAQVFFLEQTWIEIWGESWLPCAAFYWLQVVGIPVWLFPQVTNGVRLLRLFEYNELKALVTKKKQLTDAQSQRMKRLQGLMSSSSILLRFVGFLIIMWTLLAIIFAASQKPYMSSNYGCRMTAPPWERQALVMTDTAIDPMVIAFMAMLGTYAVSTVWVVVKLRAYQQKGVTESLGLVRELMGTYCTIFTALSICTVLMYSMYSQYATTYNWLQFPDLTAMLCALYFMIIPVTMQSKAVSNLLLKIRGHQTVSPYNTSLSGVLQDRLGYQYLLLQCRSEFSEENIVALRALSQFRVTPTLAAMQDIYRVFIVAGAALQVNISNAARDRVQQTVHWHTAASLPADMADTFKEVEAEVMKLVENNSWVRFKQSSMYQRYLEGELPPNCTQSDIEASMDTKRSSFTSRASKTQDGWHTPRDGTRTAAHIGIRIPEPTASAVGLPTTRTRGSFTAERYISIPQSTTPTHRTIRSSVPSYGHPTLQPLDTAAHMQLQAESDAFARPQGSRTPVANMQAHRRTTSGSPMLQVSTVLANPPTHHRRRSTLHRSMVYAPTQPEAGTDLVKQSELEVNVVA